MEPQLTRGAVRRWVSGDISGYPIVQAFDIKKISGNNNSDRYRLCISDGEIYQQAMLATQLNYLIVQNQLVDGAIIQLTEFIANVVAGRQIIIILNLTIKERGPLQRIGNPVSVETITPQQHQTHQMQQNTGIRQNQMQNAPYQQRPHSGGTGQFPNSLYRKIMQRFH